MNSCCDLDIDCCEPWFSHIQSGIKPAEGRLAKKKFTDLKKGDIVRMFKSDEHGNIDPNKFMDLIVMKVERYKSFAEMLEKEGLEKILPSIKTIADGVAVYRQWFSEEDEKSLGVVAIHVEKKSDINVMGNPFDKQTLEQIYSKDDPIEAMLIKELTK